MKHIKSTAALVVAATLALAAGSAAADGGDVPIEAWAGVSTLTRAQVRDELGDAVARDEIASHGERGYEPAPAVSTRSRAEVLAELREAHRLGLVSHVEAETPIASAEQEDLIAQAGRAEAERLSVSNPVGE